MLSLNNFVNLPSLFQRYFGDFRHCQELALKYFFWEELNGKGPARPKELADLINLNLGVCRKAFYSGLSQAQKVSLFEFENFWKATLGLNGNGGMLSYLENLQGRLDFLAQGYDKAILEIQPDYGFHFERGRHKLVAETERFLLYQVAPVDDKIKIDSRKKPILIVPPFVLGANILAFLPKENRSYAHCFANLGIPTYIRIMKDINTTEALQLMTPEDDCLDTRYFCEKIVERNAKPVTLNGYCQGGYMVVCDYLTGKLDGVVDALITCVSPMDGTRSKGLANFLFALPKRYNDLAYGTKTLPNGNKVADGKLMGWVYKLKSIEHESPVAAYCRDLMMLGNGGKKITISKTAAAINYWLNYERTDLPMAITKMSFDSYNTPITKDGTLPVKMFDQELNLKRIEQKGIKWLICYGINDDLVEKETALAPLDYIKAEVSAFPKGHVAIATSWSLSTSECALHSFFGDSCRGPVRFQLDLDEEISE